MFMSAEKKRSEECSSVAAFYGGRSILVTGGTGFLGKVLLEKLLRSCPDVREIFLLMRPKGELSIDDRLRKMLQLPLFDKLRETNPSSFEKLIPIRGDTSVDGLSIPSVERRVVIERVSVIFHVAANVRFNENLKKDIFSNTRSTRDICILAGSMKNLVALMHVSTAYAHADKPIIEETMYPPLADWRNAIRMVESLDERTVQTFTSKYLGSMPNTYTFSKRLAEQGEKTVNKGNVVASAVVISTLQDPVPGWLDNFNGPVGLMVGGAKGILRVARVEPDVAGNFLPVDVAIKIMLTATWKRGLKTVTKDPSVHVYNGTSDNICRVSMKELIAMGFKKTAEMPLEGVIWYPRTMVTNSGLLHYVLTMILHLLPACIIDTALRLAGRRPILLNLQRMVYCSMVQLSHFVLNEWTFQNCKARSILVTEIPPAEREIFGYDYKNFSVDDYFRNCLLGAKRYLLNEWDPSRVEIAKRHYDRMKRIDKIFNVCAIGLLVWIVGKTGILSHIFNTLRYLVD